MSGLFYSGIDQMGNKMELAHKPERIVSLVPSQTELLFDLGLEQEIVGITKFCIHPFESCREKTRVGGTKKFNFDLIDRLKPDLIIGNKEENYREGVEKLQRKYPVWMSDVSSLKEAFDMMEELGEVLGKKKEARELRREIRRRFLSFSATKHATVLYLIWKEPYMTVGVDTFIHDMLLQCGLKNIVAATRYPSISIDEIRSLAPEIVLLSSEPFPFSEKHVGELQKAIPDIDIALVDGEMFSWYGSRLKYAPAYFRKIHDTLLPLT